MLRRNTWVLITIIVVFALALWVLLPIEGERFGQKGIQFGLDLKGGVRLVYQADLSQVQAGIEITGTGDCLKVMLTPDE